jgi:hypothetical protein
MEVGKGQQAGARTKQAAVYPHHCGQDERLSGKRLWAFIQTTADTNRPLNSTSEEEWPSMTPSQKQTGGVLMKNDFEVKLYMSERRKGVSQKQAAARAGMSERTCTGYLVHLFWKGHRQSDRTSLPWLQMDVQPG